MTRAAQRVSWKVLICEQSHAPGPNRKDLCCLQAISRVSEASEKVLAGKAREVAENFLFASVICDEIQDELDREARSLPNGLSRQDLWIDDDAILPMHCNRLHSNYSRRRRPAWRCAP